MQHKNTKLVAFICGDLFVTLGQITGNIWADAGHFGVKLLATLVIGIAGGIAGVVGKDLYQHFKEKYKK